MILSDLGATVAANARAELKKRAQHQKVNTGAELRSLLKDVLTDMMLEDSALDISGAPAVVLGDWRQRAWARPRPSASWRRVMPTRASA